MTTKRRPRLRLPLRRNLFAVLSGVLLTSKEIVFVDAFGLPRIRNQIYHPCHHKPNAPHCTISFDGRHCHTKKDARSFVFCLHATSSRNLKADQQRNNNRFQNDKNDITTTSSTDEKVARSNSDDDEEHREFEATTTRTKRFRASNDDKRKRTTRTSSSENLQEGKRKSTQQKSSSRSITAVERLARAAARATEEQQQQKQKQESTTSTSNSSSSMSVSSVSSLSSLTQLNKKIDEQILLNQKASSSFFVNGIVRQTRDSMTSLLGHNNDQLVKDIHPSRLTLNAHQVAVVFGKSLVDDRVSVEYAARIQSLVQYLLDTDEEVDVICFCGGAVTHTTGVHSSDAGYLYFRHLCAAQHVKLDDIEFVIDRSSSSSKQQQQHSPERLSLQRLMLHLQRQYIPQWLATSVAVEGSLDTYTGEARRRKKIGVQFVLVSSEYHLCSMNDIHVRSPNQSWLRPIQRQEWQPQQGQPSNNYNTFHSESDDDDDDDDEFWDDDDHHHFENQQHARIGQSTRGRSSLNGVVETSWNYQYATYPYIYAKEDTTAFMGRCYLLGQELMPLLVNLRGVVAEKEFCQRDNYLVLSSIRRSLVTYMEKLYETQPFLRDELRDVATNDMNVILEGAVLSLGRCMDLLRPAGLLVGSVNKSDYSKALRLLEHAVGQIQRYCDPDLPLEPHQWGKLRMSETMEQESEEVELQVHPEVAAEQAVAAQELAAASRKAKDGDESDQEKVSEPFKAMQSKARRVVENDLAKDDPNET